MRLLVDMLVGILRLLDAIITLVVVAAITCIIVGALGYIVWRLLFP